MTQYVYLNSFNRIIGLDVFVLKIKLYKCEKNPQNYTWGQDDGNRLQHVHAHRCAHTLT